MPCIFCLSITLFFRYLQNGDFRPFRDSFFAPDFDIIQEQTSILSVPERPSTVYSVFPALRPFRNGNKNPRKCTFYICEPIPCTINAANFTRKRIFPEIMCISCVNWRFYIILQRSANGIILNFWKKYHFKSILFSEILPLNQLFVYLQHDIEY